MCLVAVSPLGAALAQLLPKHEFIAAVQPSAWCLCFELTGKLSRAESAAMPGRAGSAPRGGFPSVAVSRCRGPGGCRGCGQRAGCSLSDRGAPGQRTALCWSDRPPARRGSVAAPQGGSASPRLLSRPWPRRSRGRAGGCASAARSLDPAPCPAPLRSASTRSFGLKQGVCRVRGLGGAGGVPCGMGG